MSASALWFVGRYSHNVPVYDDWTGLVPCVVGEVDRLSWLWEQNQEHRMPLPKCLLVVLGKLTGWDLRSGPVFNVAALAVLAALMVWTARRLRGQACFFDAFLPIVLLNWGHYENLLHGWQIQFVASTCLAGVMLCLLVGAEVPTVSASVASGLCLVLLPWCGGNGLLLVPGLSVWLSFVAWQYGRAPRRDGRRQGLLVGGLVGLALLNSTLYFVGLGRGIHPPSPGPRATLKVTLEFLSMNFGPAAEFYCPYSGWITIALMVSVAGMLAGTLFLVRGQHHRVVGLACFLGSYATLALALGWGRAGIDRNAGFYARYVTLGTPVACAAYFAAVLRQRGGGGPLAQACLFSLACLVLDRNAHESLKSVRVADQQMQAFEQDLRDGTPPCILMKRYSQAVFPDHDTLGRRMLELRASGVGPFRWLRKDPAMQAISVPVVPAELHQARWDGGELTCTGDESWVSFALDPPTFIAGIRLGYEYLDGLVGQPCFQIDWKRPGQEGFPPEQCFTNGNVDTDRGEKHMTAWIADVVEQIRIHPNNRPVRIRLSGATLLIPVMVYRIGERLHPDRGAAELYLREGWHAPEKGHRWSSQRASFEFVLEHVEPLRLRMRACALGEEPVQANLNGRPVGTLPASSQPDMLELSLPPDALASSNVLTFTVPGARPPGPEDRRVLGLCIEWFELIPDTAPR
jgi:hypothetical protein